MPTNDGSGFAFWTCTVKWSSKLSRSSGSIGHGIVSTVAPYGALLRSAFSAPCSADQNPGGLLDFHLSSVPSKMETNALGSGVGAGESGSGIGAGVASTGAGVETSPFASVLLVRRKGNAHSPATTHAPAAAHASHRG